MLPEFLPFVWDEKDTNPPLTLLTAGPRVLSFVASVASCKVAKLPSCIRFFLLSSTLRIAHLLVKAFCMLPKFPVPDCKF